jgi:hypothetical protein
MRWEGEKKNKRRYTRMSISCPSFFHLFWFVGCSKIGEKKKERKKVCTVQWDFAFSFRRRDRFSLAVEMRSLFDDL